MSELLSKAAYEEQTASTRDTRMAWWREARFGMFIHYGLYSVLGRHEWAMSVENWPISEYEQLADQFNPKPGAPREWAKLAKEAGMKYMVMTTRHHEGFSLWDSKVNPYNSVNHGPKRDIVKEFVEACREYDLGIGFYTSLMDWHHPDGWRCAFDTEARIRFNAYIRDLNYELLTQYGKIDILWYDVPAPMESWEGWDSLQRNQEMRALQPDIIINNRSRLDEDFGTPEEHIRAMDRDWEACMTFNGLSWGYVDMAQVGPYSYNAQQIIKMLNTCTAGGGNLLLNIGPTPDGSVPQEAFEPLRTVGRWLEVNGDAVYGQKRKLDRMKAGGLCGTSADGQSVYLWNWIWPEKGTMHVGGFASELESVTVLGSEDPVDFEQTGHRITLRGLPKTCPDSHAGVAVVKLTFKEEPKHFFASYYPQLSGGRDFAAGVRED